MQAQLDLAFRRLRSEEAEDVLCQLAEREVLRAKQEAPGFDPGEVEDVVDQGEERLDGGADDPDLLALEGRQLAVEQKLGHTENAVNRVRISWLT